MGRLLVFEVAGQLRWQLGCQPIGTVISSFAVARSGPGTGRNRQLQCPRRLARHETGKFFGVAESNRDFAHDLIVHVQHDGVAGGLDAQHGVGKQIAGDAGHDIFGPQAAVRTMAVAARYRNSLIFAMWPFDVLKSAT